ncbi:3-oxoacyl-[acyl-carrier-protein] synthase III C-terminal domain-containing protein [Mesorhizobium sp. M0898]|uniref:3-oxoacyl-ACP synthase III family protein n=1 Tax=Mesorhizobium sp. M0898 TaxID=2957020 RepID=UPI0033391BFF
MRINSVVLRTPSRLVSNDDILNYIREYNFNCDRDDVEAYCRKVDRLFRRAGSKTRYVRDKDTGERAFDLLLDAARSAIGRAGLAAKDIDLTIYCGIGRGFLEPANAVFLVSALGIECDAFDITEACMSWARALQVAESLLLTKSYAKILIVNAEFSVFENGFPDIFKMRSDAEIAYTFPALTVGEAATATVVTSSPHAWKIRFRTKAQFASLCCLPLPGFDDFCMVDSRAGANGPHQLVAHGSELARTASREMTSFVQTSYPNIADIDVWLPHSSSESDLKLMASKLNIGDRLYHGIFRKFGNLASASIPAAIVEATEKGVLKRGQRVVFCPASAGMVFGLIEGTY